MRHLKYRDLLIALVCLVAQMNASVAWAQDKDNRALRLSLEKGVITQEEYDRAVEEEKAESKSQELTKNGLTVKLGGFAEIDFFADSTRSFEEIIGNRPVLRSDTLAGANSQFQTSPRNSRIIFDVRAPERNGIKSQFYGSVDFFEGTNGHRNGERL